MPVSPEPASPLLSVVVSFRNEADVLPELIRRLQAVFARLPVAYELLFVNDASTDGSLDVLQTQRAADPRIKIITMSRRFGVAECVLAGMRYARGAAVITMDADLQDPPELIPELVTHWQAGAEVAYTVRTRRPGDGARKTWLTRLGYHTIRLIADPELPIDAGDFKLIGRRVVNELLQLNEKDPYLRGLVTWMGFKQVPVYYERAARFKGRTHFPLLGSAGPIKTLVSGLVSFSTLPLVAALVIGLTITGLALACAVVAAALSLFAAGAAPIAWLIIVLSLFSGVQLTAIGLLGIYVGRVYNDVRNRPRYIVDHAIGFGDPPLEPAGGQRPAS